MNRIVAAWQAVTRLFKIVFAVLSRLIPKVIGQIHWQAPSWFESLGRAAARLVQAVFAGPKRITALLLALMSIGAGWYWYAHRPKPHYVAYSVTEPKLSLYGDAGITYIYPLWIDFEESAARIDDVGRKPSVAVDLSPAIPGSWTWISDRRLEFKPRTDWPIDARVTVQLTRKKLFADGVQLESYTPRFQTPAFTARLAETSFYQDPRDPNLKKLVATVAFSHPVDTGDLERRVSIDVAKDAAYLGLEPDSRHFTVTYDKWKLNAFVHSVPLAMPRDDTPMTLHIAKGVRAERGGNETAAGLDATIAIPGRSSLRFSGATMTLVENARFEPEQVLMITSSSPVAERALNGKLSVYLLPVRHPKQNPDDKEPYRWTDAERIGKDILGLSRRVALTYVADGNGDTRHGFKFLAPVDRYLFLEVQQGVDGVGGYFSGKPYIATVQVEPYKKALRFLGQGALLSQSGDHKVGFLVRDVDHVEVEIGRLLPNQLQHIAGRMWDFAKPSLDSDIKDKIIERFTSIRDFTGKAPGKPTYDSIDLSKYVQNRGLFLLRLRAVKGKDDAEPDDQDDSVSGDERLILITDLGIIAKLSKEGGRDVFVQSIRSGLPVGGARVEILGKNGLAVQSATTDSSGRAQLPKLGELRRDKTPLILVAQTGNDFSFMPLRAEDRHLQLSRFDTGGIENPKTAQQVAAYLFSDRGIYRPAETAHLGLVARTADWKGSLADLPVEVEITDPRGAIVSRNSLRLSPSAFEELSYTSQPSSATGSYQAAAYLAKDPKNRELLGSVNFKVQEFEPDRMKIRLDLSSKTVQGWLRPADVQARATVAHLFGEAASKRRVEGELSLSAAFPSFPRYADYRFQLSETLKEPFRENLTPVLTDDKGVADFKIDLARFASRAYRLSVLARAFEAEGGRNVAAQSSVLISDSAFLVGVKADGALDFVRRGTSRQANWLAVNQQLAPVAAEGLSLEWVERKYVSVLTEQSNQTFKFVSRMKEVSRETRKVRIASGGSNFALPTQEPGDFVLILRDGAGVELNRLTYTVAGEANLTRSLDRDAELQIHLDKAAYKGGDTIEASIRAPYTGAGLITIERDRVLHHQWFKTSTTSSVQRIVLPRDFEGNGYVNIQFVRDPASDNLFVSPLSYGVAAFAADLSPRTQAVQVTAAGEVKPGAILVMKVNVAEPSRVALLAVDEGILQVARYRNPNPLGFFFQKHMLEVETSQILDLILPEFKRFLAMAAPGGDGDGGFAKHLNPFAKKRRPPVAYWSGLVDVNPGGREFRYTVPDYFNGKLRIVAIAVNPRRVGVAEAATEVKGPFILTPNVPTMLAPGDEVLVSAGVFNNTVGGRGPIRLEVQSGPGLISMGANSVNLDIADKKEGAGEFRFKANAILGAVSVKFIARRGNAEARMEESISVRPPVAYRTSLTLGRLDASRRAVPLMRNLYSENRKVEAATSAVPLVWGQGLAQWLETYPYSCTEQWVSKGMASLVLPSRPDFAAVTNTINILQSRANDRGGFGLWTSSPNTAEFPTVYAGLFLVEAKERGQRVPPALLANLNVWLARFAATPASTLEDARARAFAVYLLVRQGISSNSALSNVEQELTRRYPKEWPNDLAAAWLAATYRLMQRNDEADKILRAVPWSRGKKDWGDELYYGATGHDAELIYLMARHFPTRMASIPPAALEDIASAINDNRLNSLTAAFTLLALDGYAKSAVTNLKLGISEIAKDGRERALVPPRAAVSEAAAKLQFSKDGSVPAYYAVNESGFDRSLPAQALSNGIEIFKEYLDVRGNPITRVKVGEEFLVRLRIRSLSRDLLRQIVVVDLLPGGAEPVIEVVPTADGAYGGLPIGVPGQSNWVPQNVNVREDRVLLYGDATKNVSSFSYRVRATNAGVFQSPPAFVEGMYDPKISAQALGGKLEVVKP